MEKKETQTESPVVIHTQTHRKITIYYLPFLLLLPYTTNKNPRNLSASLTKNFLSPFKNPNPLFKPAVYLSIYLWLLPRGHRARSSSDWLSIVGIAGNPLRFWYGRSWGIRVVGFGCSVWLKTKLEMKMEWNGVVMRVHWSGRILRLTGSPVGPSPTLLIRRVTSGLEVTIVFFFCLLIYFLCLASRKVRGIEMKCKRKCSI